MSQPSTSDNTMTSEEHDQEVEEYIWNLMGKCGLLSEIKSQIAQFVQNNGKTKEKVTVDAARVNPAILSMIYEYLKWVGMKNACALLLVESPVQFDTSSVNYDSSPNGPPYVPELCTYLSEKKKCANGMGGSGKSFNGASSLPFLTSTPTAAAPGGLASAITAATAALNQTFDVTAAQTISVNNQSDRDPDRVSMSASGSIDFTSLSPPPNIQNGSDLDFLGSTVPQSPTETANDNKNICKGNSSGHQNDEANNPTTTAVTGTGASDSSESEHTTTASVSKSGKGHSHSDKREKLYSQQFEKSLNESMMKKAHSKSADLFNQEKGKELKPCNSDQSLQSKSRDQHQFSFMTEKQKMEALNKKFSGSELIPKKKSSTNTEDSSSSTATASHRTLSSSKADQEKDKDKSWSRKEDSEIKEKSDRSQKEEKEPENLMDISNPWKSKSSHHNNNNNHIMSEPDFDESISDLHDSTAEDITQDLSMDSDSKVIAANIAECEHLMKLK